MGLVWPIRRVHSGSGRRGMSSASVAALIGAILLATTGPAAIAASAAAVKFYEAGVECYAGPLALQLPDTYPQLLALGKVERTQDLRTQGNRGSTTTERAVIFEGLTLTVDVFSKEPDRYQLAKAVISDPRWQLSRLRVGEPAELMLATRGWPAPPADGTWEMQGDASHVLVAVRHGLIATIRYDCSMP
jgi:hypothetical protein